MKKVLHSLLGGYTGVAADGDREDARDDDGEVRFSSDHLLLPLLLLLLLYFFVVIVVMAVPPLGSDEAPRTRVAAEEEEEKKEDEEEGVLLPPPPLAEEFPSPPDKILDGRMLGPSRGKDEGASMLSVRVRAMVVE